MRIQRQEELKEKHGLYNSKLDKRREEITSLPKGRVTSISLKIFYTLDQSISRNTYKLVNY